LISVVVIPALLLAHSIEPAAAGTGQAGRRQPAGRSAAARCTRLDHRERARGPAVGAVDQAAGSAPRINPAEMLELAGVDVGPRRSPKRSWLNGRLPARRGTVAPQLEPRQHE